MRSPSDTYKTSLPLFIKCGGIFLLLLLTVVVVACGSNSTQVAPGTPVATLTVVFGQPIASPTPVLAPYYCGGWATDTSPAYSPNSVVNVYGKYTHTVDGNPVGVGGAAAVATVLWPDGSSVTEQTTTGSDGLAVFSITMQASAINHVVLIQMRFSIPNVPPCNLTSPAFFTAIQVSPTPTNTAMPSPTGAGSPGATPSVSPTAGGTITPTGTPNVTPTGKPGG